MPTKPQQTQRKPPPAPPILHLCPHCRLSWLAVGATCGLCRKKMTARGAE